MRIKATILALILCIGMVSSAPCVLAEDQGDESSVSKEYFVLMPENFTLPAEWSFKTTSIKMAGQFSLNYVQGTKNVTQPATATVYIDTPGEYVIWGQAYDTEKTSPKTREYIAGFDGNYGEAVYSSKGDIRTLHWNVSTEPVYLEEGLHIVNLMNNSTAQAAYVGALIITNDLEAVYTTETTYDSVKQYGDIEVPDFGTSVVAPTHNSLTSAIITFPIATDTSGIANYEYFFDDALVEPVDDGNGNMVYDAQNLTPFKTYEAKCVAYDYFGNKSEIVSSIEMVEWKLDKTTSSIDKTNLESQGKISVNIALSYIKGAKDAKIFCAIYSADETQLVGTPQYISITERTSDAINGETFVIDVPETVEANPQNYVIKATVVDSQTNLMPHTDGIKFDISTGGQI